MTNKKKAGVLATWTLAFATALPPQAIPQSYIYRIPIHGIDARPADSGAPLAAGNYGGTYEAIADQPLTIVRPSVSGGRTPYSYALTGFVPGMAFSDGNLAGAPAQAGTYQLTLNVSDSGGASLTRDLTLVVQPPPAPGEIAIAVAPGVPSEAIAESAIAPIAVTATGGNGPISITVTGSLPNGLNFDGSTLSGAPAAAGTHSFGFSADDGDPATSPATRAATMTVYGKFTGTIAQSPQANAVAGTDIAPVEMALSGGKAPYAYSHSGALPPGVTFADGVLSGRPTTPGTYSFRLIGSESLRPESKIESPAFAMTVAPADLAIAGFSVPQTLRAGTDIAPIPLSITGGTQPYALALTGNSVPGLQVDGSSIRGRPTEAGTYEVALRVTDGANPPQVKSSPSRPVTVREALTASFDGGATQVARQGQPFSAAATVSGAYGTATASWSSTPIPGIAVTAAGASGTPSASGSQSASVRFTDPSDGAHADIPLTLQVDPAASFALAPGQGVPGLIAAGQPANIAVATSGVLGTASFAGAPNGSHPTTLASLGLAVAGDASGAAITGTPPANVNGNYTVNIRMTEVHAGKTYPVEKQVLLQIQPPPSAGNQFPAATDNSGNPISVAALYDSDGKTGVPMASGNAWVHLTYAESVAANGYATSSSRTDVSSSLQYKNAQGAWTNAGSIGPSGTGNGATTFGSVSAREWRALFSGAGAAWRLNALKITNSTSSPSAPVAPSVSRTSNSATLTAAIDNADNNGAGRTIVTRADNVSWQLQAADLPNGGTWVVAGGSLPAGLTLSASGLISGSMTGHYEDVDVGIAVDDGRITSATKVLRLSVRTDKHAMRDVFPTFTRGSEGGPEIDARILADTDTSAEGVPNATTANGGAIYMNFPHPVYATYHSYYGTGGQMRSEHKDLADGTWKAFGATTPGTVGGVVYAQTFRYTAVDDSRDAGKITALLERGGSGTPPLVSASVTPTYTVKRGNSASIAIGVNGNPHFGGTGYTGALEWTFSAPGLPGIGLASSTDPGTYLAANGGITAGWAAGTHVITVEVKDSRSTSLPKTITVTVTN